MSEINKALIKKISDGAMQGETGFFVDCLADDASWSIVGISTVNGKENILRAMESQELLNLPEIKVQTISTEMDSVTVQSSGNGRGRNGLPWTASYFDVYRLKDGKIKEFTTYVIDSVER